MGINSVISSPPYLPHNLHGIFISENAKIGKDVTIYQHVTIGSNQLKGSKNFGAPTIENGVLIGAGAKIIGRITIGKNSRIGAGCIVTKTIPANSVVVMSQPNVMEKESLTNYIVNDSSSFY